MVKISSIELPISYIRNGLGIMIEFNENQSNKYFGKVINILLKSQIPSEVSEWTYKHLLQPTNRINLIGLEDDDYTLEITSDNEQIDLEYNVTCKDTIWNFKTIETNPQSIYIDTDEINGNSRQFGGAFGGALLTSGSFTMMAASGGF